MVDAIGVVGLLLLLGAFIANAAGRLRADHWLYPAMNAAGAGIEAWYSVYKEVWIFFVLETVWTAAALINLARAARRSRRASAGR